ncbi:bestrophin family protein [Skeletonema marinoi]|uniref:Bestrophin family protein n=2 Tax=Skeletonema marinoi TaxID=267567 RepID=A0AAD8Y3I2_9STRA|nr:bestrophin family protein [Skeletonema marinoi]KAK1738782.1 bestrophin family protein [Skeletonema marinoi]
MTMATSPSPPTSSDTEGSIEVNPPHPQPQDNPSKINQLTKSRSMIARFNGSSTRRHAELDDEEGKAQFFLTLLFASIEDSAGLFAGTVLFLVVWAILCSFGAQELRGLAATNPGGAAEQWLDDIESCKNAVSIIGTLFVFTLVFRFNACYDRWWESRILWGDIISKCLELGMMNRRWFANEELQDRFSRFVIVYSYACKSMLRGKSLTEEGEDGPDLVKRGLLTQQELDLMEGVPCWQPHFCLDMLREVIAQLHMIPGGKGLRMDDTNKIHGQLFRCLDNTLKHMNDLIGSCVRIRASGLPASYDAITMTSFITFFLLASAVWSTAIGWMTPIVVFLASMIIMFLIVMGTKLVDPFGSDKVDIPLECFCATIEAQVHAIDQRGKSIIAVASNSKKAVRPLAVRSESKATFHIPRLA